MAYSAAQWRPLIRQETARYANTPGGAPPWQIVEGQIDLESGGDPTNVTDTGTGDVAVGLGQIVPSGLEYGLYRQRFPQGPTDLTDPQTNLKVMVLGLDYREELGVKAQEAGQPHALTNWLTTAAAYFGAASNSGVSDAADRFGTTGYTYVNRIKDYMRTVLKLTDAQIDQIAGGQNVAQGGSTGIQDASPPASGGGGGTSIFGAVSGLLESGIARGLPAIAGFLLLAFGLYKVIAAS